ncbi:hypothetical protein GUITHDRAFT_165492 [Guillardia theta CCMP2712]|uniref:PDZ domain-containing protein n=2 Tax=Guillardia theta TaxID=55529 RepID=L1IN93_GUITC|nr:hypothetical protein GUITHDRAFT_165492 [Guillardia theta CCMP2712]EKX37354.1 hypothetical protein GUITHDRAFT_165492 [Guillardia theta CCMP2712]|eukprot:XP_005824334.1 hypothetical protein GUITHDRAFT_165492 [Guillardia theta CCMP2712]
MRGARDLHRAPSREDLYSSQRSIDSVASRSLLTGNGTGMSGVGIFFQQEGDGKVYVRTIVSGGSAERDGRVRVGDVMCGVDGRDVIGEPVSVLRSLLLGHEGSTVVLTFARAVEAGMDAETSDMNSGNTVIAKFDVELVRGSPEYFNKMDSARKYEIEMQDLRHQLKQTLSEEKEISEEVERVRRVLQLERGASARREKELEEIRSSHAREVASLSESLRRAEQSRREASGRLAPVKSREQELSEELARMKEKDRLRKEYVEELRKRHEEETSRLEAQLAKEQRARREEQAARIEVERELEKSRKELKKELDIQRSTVDQDKSYREQVESSKKKLRDVVETMESLYAMMKDLDDWNNHVQDGQLHTKLVSNRHTMSNDSRW